MALVSHLDTLADRLIDGVTHYIPAEMLLLCVVFLLSFALLFYAASRLSAPDDHHSGDEGDEDQL